MAVATAKRVKHNGGTMPPKRTIDTKTYLGRVAVRLTALRTEAGLSVESLVTALNKAGYPIAGPTVYAWEQGRSTPHVEALPHLAKIYRLKTPGEVLPTR